MYTYICICICICKCTHTHTHTQAANAELLNLKVEHRATQDKCQRLEEDLNRTRKESEDAVTALSVVQERAAAAEEEAALLSERVSTLSAEVRRTSADNQKLRAGVANVLLMCC